MKAAKKDKAAQPACIHERTREVTFVLAMHAPEKFNNELREREAWGVFLAAQRFLEGVGYDTVISTQVFSTEQFAPVLAVTEAARAQRGRELDRRDAINRGEVEA
jgi:hypothetical protein